MKSLAKDLMSMAVAATEAAAEMTALVDGIWMFEVMAVDNYTLSGIFFSKSGQEALKIKNL